MKGCKVEMTSYIVCDDSGFIYIISNVSKPCIICGKMTNKYEHHYSANFCSNECASKFGYRGPLSKPKGENNDT